MWPRSRERLRQGGGGVGCLSQTRRPHAKAIGNAGEICALRIIDGNVAPPVEQVLELMHQAQGTVVQENDFYIQVLLDRKSVV